jgi:hypothetical protein
MRRSRGGWWPARKEKDDPTGAADCRGGSWRSALLRKEARVAPPVAALRRDAEMRKWKAGTSVAGDEHGMQRGAAARSRFGSPGVRQSCTRAVVSFLFGPSSLALARSLSYHSRKDRSGGFSNRRPILIRQGFSGTSLQLDQASDEDRLATVTARAYLSWCLPSSVSDVGLKK